jgi:dihydrofolate reductase
MATITAFESITLDGVMQGLGRPDEDTRDGFAHGGWGQGYSDDVLASFVGEGMQQEGALLFGHRTYADVLGHWSSVGPGNPFTQRLLSSAKYVMSRSADASVDFPNSTLLVGEAVDTVAELQATTQVPLQIIGSGALVVVARGGADRPVHAADPPDRAGWWTAVVRPVRPGGSAPEPHPADVHGRGDRRVHRSECGPRLRFRRCHPGRLRVWKLSGAFAVLYYGCEIH